MSKVKTQDWADEKAAEIVNAYRNREKPLSDVIAAALRQAREEAISTERKRILGICEQADIDDAHIYWVMEKINDPK